MTIPEYSWQGTKTGDITLPAVFSVARHDDVIARALRFISNSARESIANTKKRGEVAGTGKKPWRQKGTGRARQGSTRSPQWVGGGVAFGPTPERNWATRLNKKMRQLALVSALSAKAADGEMIAIQAMPAELTKTNQVAKALASLPVAKKRLLIAGDVSEALLLTTRNVPGVQVTPGYLLNLHDVITAKQIVLMPGAAERIQVTWGPKIATKRLTAAPAAKTTVKKTTAVAEAPADSVDVSPAGEE